MPITMKKALHVGCLVILAALTACATPTTDVPMPTPMPTSTSVTQEPATPVSSATEGPAWVQECTVRSQEAPVESIQLDVLESFPVQVQATLAGDLPSGCSRITSVVQRRRGNDILVGIYLEVAAESCEVACSQEQVSFERRVAIQVEGLEAGTYNVRAGEARASFTLDVDNIAPEVDEADVGRDEPALGVASCPSVKEGTLVYIDETGSFCLLYPAGFRVASPQASITVISVPEEDRGLSPSLTIMIGPGEGTSIDSLVAGLEERHANIDLNSYETTIDGERAVVVENVPGVAVTQQAFVAHDDLLYTFIAKPMGGDVSAEQIALVEEAWATTLASFTFLSQDDGGQGGPSR